MALLLLLGTQLQFLTIKIEDFWILCDEIRKWTKLAKVSLSPPCKKSSSQTILYDFRPAACPARPALRTWSRTKNQHVVIKIKKLNSMWAHGSIWVHVKTGWSQMGQDHLNSLNPS